MASTITPSKYLSLEGLKTYTNLEHDWVLAQIQSSGAAVAGFYYNGKFYAEPEHTTELPAYEGNIYISLGENNKLYRYVAFIGLYEPVALPDYLANLNTTTIACGGIAKGTDLTGKTIQQVLEMLLAPYVAPVLNYPSASRSPSGILEYGSTSTVSSVYCSWTKGSKDLTELSISGDYSETVTNPTGSSKTFSFTPLTISGSATKNFTVTLKDGTNILTKNCSVSNSYAYPYYAGTCKCTASELTAAIIQAQKKTIGDPSSYTVTTDDSSLWIVVSKPVTKITDGAGVNDYTNAFEHTTISLSSSSPVWGPNTFHVYVGPRGTATDFTYRFTY